MEVDNKEKNNNKRKIYLLISVVILIVVIIGSTYAYFSAAVNAGGDSITGNSNSNLKNALTLNVTRLNSTVTNATNINLVPSDITATESSILNAVNMRCEASGFTGCHLYQIRATTSQNIPGVNINLDTLNINGTNNVTATSSWKYAIFTATGTYNTFTSVTLSTVTNGTGSFNLTSPVDMHSGAELTVANGATYYLLIWIENDENNPQNLDDENSVIGTYNGSVSMNAGTGGKVVACFGTDGTCVEETSSKDEVYLVSNDSVSIGSEIPSGITTYRGQNGPIQAMADWANITSVANDTKPFFLKFTLGTSYETNGQLISVPVEGYVGFVIDKEKLKEENCEINDTECEAIYNNMRDGTYYLQGWVDEEDEYEEENGDYIYTGTIYNANINTIKTAIGYNNGNSSYCEDNYSTYFYCNFVYLYVYAYADGTVNAIDRNHGCDIGNDGYANCN